MIFLAIAIIIVLIPVCGWIYKSYFPSTFDLTKRQLRDAAGMAKSERELFGDAEYERRQRIKIAEAERRVGVPMSDQMKQEWMK